MIEFIQASPRRPYLLVGLWDGYSLPFHIYSLRKFTENVLNSPKLSKLPSSMTICVYKSTQTMAVIDDDLTSYRDDNTNREPASVRYGSGPPPRLDTSYLPFVCMDIAHSWRTGADRKALDSLKAKTPAAVTSPTIDTVFKHIPSQVSTRLASAQRLATAPHSRDPHEILPTSMSRFPEMKKWQESLLNLSHISRMIFIPVLDDDFVENYNFVKLATVNTQNDTTNPSSELNEAIHNLARSEHPTNPLDNASDMHQRMRAVMEKVCRQKGIDGLGISRATQVNTSLYLGLHFEALESVAERLFLYVAAITNSDVLSFFPAELREKLCRKVNLSSNDAGQNENEDFPDDPIDLLRTNPGRELFEDTIFDPRLCFDIMMKQNIPRAVLYGLVYELARDYKPVIAPDSEDASAKGFDYIDVDMYSMARDADEYGLDTFMMTWDNAVQIGSYTYGRCFERFVPKPKEVVKPVQKDDFFLKTRSKQIPKAPVLTSGPSKPRKKLTVDMNASFFGLLGSVMKTFRSDD